MSQQPGRDEHVLITCYGDMAVRERFTDELDPKLHKPAIFLSEYRFETEVPCGLSDCHQMHKHGVLFATKDGSTESNMGHICGAGHFPEEYDAARKEFRRKQAARAHLDVISEFKAKVPGYLEEIDRIWRGEQGGLWADRCLLAYRQLCPPSVCEQLTDMSRRGDWTITRERKVQADDALGLGFRRDSEVETETLGYIRGGAALLKTVISVLKPVRDQIWRYSQIDPTTLSGRKRSDWAAWSGTIPAALREAQQLVEASREFYSRENLSQLLKLVRYRSEREQLRTFFSAIDNAGRTQRKAG